MMINSPREYPPDNRSLTITLKGVITVTLLVLRYLTYKAYRGALLRRVDEFSLMTDNRSLHDNAKIW